MEWLKILGVSVYRGQGDFYYYIAVSSDLPAPAGMYAYTVPAAEWVVFENNGFFKKMCRGCSAAFCRNFFRFPGTNTQDFRMLRPIRLCISLLFRDTLRFGLR